MSRMFWTQLQPFGPAPRIGHAAAYDTLRKVVVLFGGRTSAGESGDTWTWDGSLWTQVSDIGPSARSAHAMVFDGGQVVLFGGTAGSEAAGDTWIWDGTLWTQISDVGPSARSGHATAYDRTRERTVLFGGRTAGGSLLGDTWEWDGQTWTQREDTGPAARFGHCMTHDVVRGPVVLFGGATETNVFADTWEWNGTAWSEVAHFGPQGRVSAAAVYNGSRTTLFGGSRSVDTSSLAGDTWEWDGHHWTQQQHFGPAPRSGHVLVYDSVRLHVLLFGGGTSSTPSGAPASTMVVQLQGDTWRHVPGVSTPASTLASIELDPPIVATGGLFRVRVALTGASPVPVNVSLAAEPEIMGLPTQLVVPSGATTARTDEIPATDEGTYRITASAGGGSRDATLTITDTPPVAVDVAALALLPNVRDVNEKAIAEVFLTAPALNETQVQLSSTPPIAGMPATITIGAGSNQGSGEISSGTPGSFVVTATSGASSAQSSLTVTESAAGTDLASLQVFPETIPQNAQNVLFVVVVSIRNTAQSSVTIALSASPGIPSLPGQATIPANADFVILNNIEAPSAAGTYTISATGGNASLAATLTVL